MTQTPTCIGTSHRYHRPWKMYHLPFKPCSSYLKSCLGPCPWAPLRLDVELKPQPSSRFGSRGSRFASRNTPRCGVSTPSALRVRLLVESERSTQDQLTSATRATERGDYRRWREKRTVSSVARWLGGSVARWLGGSVRTLMDPVPFEARLARTRSTLSPSSTLIKDGWPLGLLLCLLKPSLPQVGRRMHD